MKIIAIIPARGGSKGIPRKNVRMMNGKPLIAYAIENALKADKIDDVLVSTDNEEIAHVATIYGATVIDRPKELGADHITLDPVICHAVETYESQMGKVDVVITLQPTSPLMTSDTLNRAIESYLARDCDTMLSAINKPHLAWTEEKGEYTPLYRERLNRQYLPKHLMETGAFVFTKREFVTNTSRFGKVVNLFEVPEYEAIDIDDYDDWSICEIHLKRKNIVIRADGYPEIGLGHIYRAILLANTLLEHNVTLVLSEKSQLGVKKVQEHFLKYEVVSDDEQFEEYLQSHSTDILINDILDTSTAYMSRVSKLVNRVVNFEDLGEGSRYADAVINALYEKTDFDTKYYWGHKYYCLRDEFLITRPKAFSEKVKNVLIVFGGTDPGHFTEKLLQVITELTDTDDIVFQFILGLGFDRKDSFQQNVKQCNKQIQVIQDVNMMSKFMAEADIAISSQGRTMYELATMRVPTIILAQNEREMMHEFGYFQNGFINLGNGAEVDVTTIKETLSWLIHTAQIRRQMSMSMEKLNLTSGMDRVKNIILTEE